jgi:hypothetical protein
LQAQHLPPYHPLSTFGIQYIPTRNCEDTLESMVSLSHDVAEKCELRAAWMKYFMLGGHRYVVFGVPCSATC